MCLAAELEFGDELFRLNPIKITLTAYPGRLLRLIVRSLLGHATISHTMDTHSYFIEGVCGDAWRLDEAFG